MATGDSLPFPSLSPRCKRQRSPSRSPSSGSADAEASRRQRRRHDLSVEVCKDFIRSACRRAEFVCKFAHPPSTVIIERCVTLFIDSGPLGYPPLLIIVPFSTIIRTHYLSWTFRGKVIACADSIHNKCIRRRACRYFHPPPHIQEYFFFLFLIRTLGFWFQTESLQLEFFSIALFLLLIEMTCWANPCWFW